MGQTQEIPRSAYHTQTTVSPALRLLNASPEADMLMDQPGLLQRVMIVREAGQTTIFLSFTKTLGADTTAMRESLFAPSRSCFAKVVAVDSSY